MAKRRSRSSRNNVSPLGCIVLMIGGALLAISQILSGLFGGSGSRSSVTSPTGAPRAATVAANSAGSSGNHFDGNGDGRVTCADFRSHAAAQSAYSAGEIQLDGNDNDGKACESLP